MAKRVTEESRVFEFLTPEEQDNIIKKILNSTHARGGTQKNAWTEYALNIRRQVILDLLGQGLSHTRITQELMARWGVCISTAWNYYNDAIAFLTEDTEIVKANAREIMIQRLEALAEDALAHNDRKSALTAYEQLNKLNSLYTTKVEADVKTDITFDFQ